MAILKNGMSIQCRTQEEYDIFFEIGQKEGWTWPNGRHLRPQGMVPVSFQLGYGSHNKDHVTYGSIGVQYGALQNIEASQLFRNLLISRRAKHGNS